MSILSSVSSAKSLLSPKLNGYAELSNAQPAISPTVRTPSYPSGFPSAVIQKELTNLTPDELFSKYSVAEVKAVQKRLKCAVNYSSPATANHVPDRADADAKQEELRLMVGLVPFNFIAQP